MRNEVETPPKADSEELHNDIIGCELLECGWTPM